MMMNSFAKSLLLYSLALFGLAYGADHLTFKDCGKCTFLSF